MSPDPRRPPVLGIGDLRSALSLLNLEEDPPEVRIQLILGLTQRAWTLDQAAHEYLAAHLRRGLTLPLFLSLFHAALSKETGLIPPLDIHVGPAREQLRGSPFTPRRLKGSEALKALFDPLKPILKLEAQDFYPTSLPEDWHSLWEQSQKAAQLQDWKDAYERYAHRWPSRNPAYDALLSPPQDRSHSDALTHLSKLEWQLKGVLAARCWWALHAPYEPAPSMGGGS